MELRRKAREASGETAKADAEKKAKEDKKKKMKEMAALLGGELDTIGKVEAERKEVQEKIARGENPNQNDKVKLFQTLYPYKSDDPEDLSFEANEIIRVWDWADDWFEGENQDGTAKGCFPSNFVREIKQRGEKALEGMPS